MTAADATRLAGEAYRTRLARGEAATPDDKTRIAQEGYQSRLARDAAGEQSDTSEFYKLGEKIGGRYEVSAIHHGELGVVYGCFDHQTKLPRALKTVRARHARDKQVLSLFESEASVWILLEKHPYIVRAYVVERFKSLPYVITEYVRGPEGMEGDLRGWLGHPRMTLPVAVAMALQVAQGMQHAVRKVPNLVHRDLKPANILVNGDAKAMVTDFGLVHSAQSDAGTPAYMSPEQWRAEALDARSDIYAYGCILFEMFTAHRLFPALTERDWERAHLGSPPAALTSIVPELPGEIDRFVRRCLEKDPAARPESWDEIVAFFAEWYHRLTGKAVVLDFSSLALDAAEWRAASYSLWNLNRYDEMLLACDRVLAIDQNDSAAWYIQGEALRNLKRYEEAIQACDRALAIDQTHTAAWVIKSAALHELKRFEEVIRVCEQALAIEQNNARIWIWIDKGLSLHELKRYEEAIQAYDHALAIDHNHVAAWKNKGIALDGLKRHEEAIEAYDRALALDPNSVYIWNAKGQALSDCNRYEEALGAYDQALTLDPNSELVRHYRARALLQHRVFALHRGFVLQLSTLSEGATVKGIVTDITDYGAFVDLGGIDGLLHITDLAWRHIKHPTEVVNIGDEVTAKVLKVDTEKHRVSLGLKQLSEDPWDDFARELKKGDVLAESKHYAEALAAYDQALVLNPDDAHGWLKKGNALLHLERYGEALSAYDHASPLDAKGGVSYIKGFTLLKLKRYEESISMCDRALAINSSFAAAQQTKSAALQALKLYGEALTKPREFSRVKDEIAPRQPPSFWSRFWGK